MLDQDIHKLALFQIQKHSPMNPRYCVIVTNRAEDRDHEREGGIGTKSGKGTTNNIKMLKYPSTSTHLY
jgi:hypothetical protein